MAEEAKSADYRYLEMAEGWAGDNPVALALIDLAQTQRAILAEMQRQNRRHVFRYSEGAIVLERVVGWWRSGDTLHVFTGTETPTVLLGPSIPAFEAAWAAFVGEHLDKRCKTCKHWRESNFTPCLCDNKAAPEMVDVDGSFGCVLWEPREQ